MSHKVMTLTSEKLIHILSSICFQISLRTLLHNRFYFYFFGFIYMTLIGIEEMFSGRILAMMLSVILKLVILVTLWKLTIIPQDKYHLDLTKAWVRCL